MRNFRNYQIWQGSIKFVSEIYTITKQFPSHERHGLSNQLNRATVSIASNLGYISQQNLNDILGKVHIIEKKINELISVIKASYNQPKAKN